VNQSGRYFILYETFLMLKLDWWIKCWQIERVYKNRLRKYSKNWSDESILGIDIGYNRDNNQRDKSMFTNLRFNFDLNSFFSFHSTLFSSKSLISYIIRSSWVILIHTSTFRGYVHQLINCFLHQINFTDANFLKADPVFSY
jgi:hypothetical protein